MKALSSFPELNKCTEEDLYSIGHQIRTLIIETVSKKGGHLSSNLGTVELTIALLRCFNSLKDDILFDVGHQSYTYKILTDRYDRFHLLREENGLSGFPDPRESPHDKFIFGHSSTALAVGAGFAIQKKLSRASSHTIVVFGDGSMTGGESFESLNAIGHQGLPLIAILNDNKMSISPNVGALAKSFTRSFTRFRSSITCSKLKKAYKQLVKKMGKSGQCIELVGKKFKAMVKQALFPEMFFEELGFFYMGPVNGHDIKEMCEVFQQASKIQQPVLIHVYTEKGKGFSHAEANPVLFHSSPPFVVENESCKTAPNQSSFSTIFGEVLLEAGKTNSKLVAMTAAMTSGLCMCKFAKNFPERFFDFGIAEQHMVSCAAGMAHKGLKPIIGIYSTFLQRAYDQVLIDCAILKEPVIFVIDRAGAVSDDGPTHQGIFDLSFLLPIPHVTILAPSNDLETKAMLLWSLEQDRGPIFIRYPKDKAPQALSVKPIELGQADLIQEGEDVSLIFLGPFEELAKNISIALKKQHINARIINARFAKPLDKDMLLRCAQETKLLISIEDGVLLGGFGQQLCAFFQQMNSSFLPPLISFGLLDFFPTTMKREKILDICGISVDNISNTILERLGK